jgi:hypothetical protein
MRFACFKAYFLEVTDLTCPVPKPACGATVPLNLTLLHTT